MKKLWQKIRFFVEKYPIIFAAIAIYLYYLMTSYNLFQHHEERRTFLDYIMQFDSLIFMWVATAALLQLQKIRREHREEETRRQVVEKAIERQQLYEQIVNDVTELLQDSVNNPLAVISVTSQEIRKKFGKETDLIRWLDRIDGSISRISITIRELQAYQTHKMLQETTHVVSKAPK